MKRKGKIWLPLLAIVIFVLAITTVTGVSTQYGDINTPIVKPVSEIRFGIDIQGGVEVTFSPVIVYEDEDGEEADENEEADEDAQPGSDGAETTKEQAKNVSEDDLNAAQAVMEQRLASLGISDYELFKDTGNGRIILRFPWQAGESDFDPEAAIEELGASAVLTFREGYEYDSMGYPSGTTKDTIILQGTDIVKAEPATDGTEYFVQLTLSDEGAEKFEEATTRLAEENGTISIWMDNTAISAPTVNEAIAGNTAVITGSFTAAEVQSLANTINAGSLPFAMEAESYSTISSALGNQALRAMVLAGIVAFILICCFMIFNYKLVGGIACVSLLGQIACTLAFVSGYFVVFDSITLTLPGIAGIILAVGMGVDANIIMFERLKEELRSGKKLDNSLRSALKRSLAPVVDGNITVLIVAVILIGAFGPTDTIFAKILYPVFFAFGASTTGTIYSFGYTLLIGVLLNFVFGVGATRVMVTAASKFQKLRNPVWYGALKEGKKDSEPSADIVGKRKRSFAFSGILFAVILACGLIFGVGLDVEFKGGAIVTYSYGGVIDNSDVENTISDALGATVTTQDGFDSSTGGQILTVTIADSNNVNIQTLEEVLEVLIEKYENNSFSQLEVSNVSASMGKEFLAKCLVAVLTASVLILAYIAYRFRKIGGWLGGLTAIVALLHDLIVVFGVFVVLQIPLNGNFIAALLVILGYSINGSVVIYDRVRENRGLYGKKMGFAELVNLSINQSAGRAIKTTITTITALACVCIFSLVYGLDSIFTFVFPMAIGLISGAYSSLCIAGPLWVQLLSRKNSKDTKQVKE